MKKSTKTIIIIAVVVAVIAIAIPTGMYVAGNYYFTDARIYEETWNINLPRTVKEEYSKKTEQSFHGDGFSYTVFKYDDTSSDFTNNFKKEKNEEMENEVSSILSTLSVERANSPDFSHSYLWIQQEKEDGSNLYMIYDTSAKKLYVVQQTM